MAIVTAVKSGNWSDPTVWDTGALPLAGDTARPGAYAVVIDQNVDLGDGALEGTPGASGYFRVNVPEIHITCDHITNTNAPLLRYYHASGMCYFVGDIVGGTVASTHCVRLMANGGLDVRGNIYPPMAASCWSLDSGSVYGTWPINVMGNIYAGTALTNFGIYVDTRAVNIVGDLYGGALPWTNALYWIPKDIYKGLSITGNLYAGIGSPAVIESSTKPHASLLKYRIYIDGDIYAYEESGGLTGKYQAGLQTMGNSVIVVSGKLHDAPLSGCPAVAGHVVRDKEYRQPYVDLPYIDPATDEISLQRYRAGVNPQLTATVELRSRLASTI